MRARFTSENDEACSIQIYCSFVSRSRACPEGRIWRRGPFSRRRPEPDPGDDFRLARPSVLIDINGLGELARVEAAEGGEIRVGALTRYHSLERDSRFLTDCPLFADALPHIAHPQIRNRGTIGGNLSHADPASELPAIAVALRARFRVQTAKQERWVEASDFFVGALTTDLKPDEMLVEIELPRGKPRTG